MQEEVENRAVTLVISATKLTGRLLKAAILKYLASRKEKRLQKARTAPEKPTGKQTVKQLIGQNQGVSNIEITDSNIKSFERVARKYGVDFAVKKDRSVSPPKYLIFFKGRDADALTAAFKEYTAKEVKRASQDKPSVLEQLCALKAKDTAALQKLLPFRSLALSNLKNRKGVFALIGRDEDRSQSLRRTSVRSKLQQASAEQKPTAAKKKDLEL